MDIDFVDEEGSTFRQQKDLYAYTIMQMIIITIIQVQIPGQNISLEILNLQMLFYAFKDG